MQRHYCDVCGAELTGKPEETERQKVFVVTRLLMVGEDINDLNRPDHTIAIHTTVQIDGNSNGHDICVKCVRQVFEGGIAQPKGPVTR